MSRLAVINVVGLTEALIGEHTPRIAEFRKRVHGAIQLPHRQNAVRTRHRRQRLVQP